MRVDRGFLADLDVLRLRLGDLQRRLQLCWLRDFRESGARSHLLPDVHVEPLQDAVDARADVQLLDLRFFQCVERALLVDACLRHGKLRGDGICEGLDFLLSEIVFFGEFFGLHLGGFDVELGFQAELAEPLVRIFCHFRGAVLRGNGCGLGALVHQLVLELRFRLLVGGLRSFHLVLCVERLLLQLRIAQIEDDRVRFHRRAGKQIAFLDAPLGGRWDHPHRFRHEGAEAANFAEHRTALHGVGPDRRFVDARRGRLQARQRSRDHDDHQQGRADIDVAANPFLPLNIRPRYVHIEYLIRTSEPPADRRARRARPARSRRRAPPEPTVPQWKRKRPGPTVLLRKARCASSA